MLMTLSYFNLLLSVVYFLSYLQNGGSLIIAGLILVIIFNWLTLRSLEKQQQGWSALRWFTAVLTLFFGAYIGYSAILVLKDSFAHDYYPAATIRLIVSGLIFSSSIFFQLILSFHKKTNKKTE